MPRRPHIPDEGGDPPDEGGPPSRDHGARGGGFGSAAALGRAVAAAFHRGHPAQADGSGPSRVRAPALSAEDIELSRWQNAYDKLGSEPPRFNVEVNDATHSGLNAHTTRDHGPQVPLRRIPGRKTIEGRIYGEGGWNQAANGSHRWTDPSTMNRTINEYVTRNWQRIRTDLAMSGRHRAVFDAGHRVGEGFVNRGMGGLGPRQAQYTTTSVVRIVIRLVPGSDPPEPFILTTFPAGLG